MQVSELQPTELVNRLGGAEKVDELIRQDPLLGPEYGDDESPTEVDLLAINPGQRGYPAATVIGENGQIHGFQMISPYVNQWTNLLKLPWWARRIASWMGVTKSLFGLGPLLITDKTNENQVFDTLFSGIFRSIVPEIAQRIREKPLEYLAEADLFDHKNNKSASASLARGMKHPTLVLASADANQVIRMREIGLQEGWVPPSKVNPLFGLLEKILVRPSISITFKPGSFELQHRGIIEPEITHPYLSGDFTSYWSSGILTHDQLLEVLPSLHRTRPQQIATESGKVIVIQYKPDPEVLRALQAELTQRGMNHTEETLIYRALLAKR